MIENVGVMDRAGRAALSLSMLLYAWRRQDKLGVLLGFASGVLTSSAISGYCPLYKVLGTNTVGKPI